MTHAIPLDQAKKMTSLYRQQKENILSDEYKGKNILSNCETFDADSFRALLNKPDCDKLRIYFGMSDDLKIHIISVGVNSAGEEMLDGPDDILEDGTLCPPACPTPPPPYSLNFD